MGFDREMDSGVGLRGRRVWESSRRRDLFPLSDSFDAGRGVFDFPLGVGGCATESALGLVKLASGLGCESLCRDAEECHQECLLIQDQK
jgi:hypothetical protein